MTHNCIKCGSQYQDKDVEAYYCPSCLETKNKIAQQVDKKMALIGKKPVKSALQEYDEAQKVHGFVQVRL